MKAREMIPQFKHKMLVEATNIRNTRKEDRDWGVNIGGEKIGIGMKNKTHFSMIQDGSVQINYVKSIISSTKPFPASVLEQQPSWFSRWSLWVSFLCLHAFILSFPSFFQSLLFFFFTLWRFLIDFFRWCDNHTVPCRHLWSQVYTHIQERHS